MPDNQELKDLKGCWSNLRCLRLNDTFSKKNSTGIM